VLSSHTGSFLLYLVWELRPPPPPLPLIYLIKSICNCTSAAPMSSVPSVKSSTVMSPVTGNELQWAAKSLNPNVVPRKPLVSHWQDATQK